MNEYIEFALWAVVIGAVIGALWFMVTKPSVDETPTTILDSEERKNGD